ncbi:MAG: four helix bundle protein, partial [Nitrospirae bacterium]|nr:four helix bundle protein [Nitrospirota bacterium]
MVGASFEDLEVWKNRIPDFQRFLNIAKGSAAELRTQVYISQEVKVFSNSDAKELIQELK